MRNTIDRIQAVYTLPLPCYVQVALGTLVTPDGKRFAVYAGADERTIGLLRERSNDPTDAAIRDFTSDRERFGEGSYEEWYAKDRTPFVLLSETGELAAFAWFGPKPLGRKSLKYLSDEERAKEGAQHEDVWHTLVYRSYAPYRGKGLMTDFVRFATTIYKKHFPDAKLWVGMSANNAGSTALATKLGYKRRDDLYDAEKNWVAMTLE